MEILMIFVGLTIFLLFLFSPKAQKQPKKINYELKSRLDYIQQMRKKLKLPFDSQIRKHILNQPKETALVMLEDLAYKTRLEGLKRMNIQRKSLLNQSELQIFYQLLEIAQTINKQEKTKFAIYPQVAMRAFIQDNESEFYYIVGNRYVDFAIVNFNAKPLFPKCVIEYFGDGHFGATPSDYKRAKQSDSLKQAILDKIDLPLIIIENHNNQWREQLIKILSSKSC